MKKYFLVIGILVFAFSCFNNSQTSNGSENQADDTYKPEETASQSSNDELANQRGIGKFTQIDLPANIDQPMAIAGKLVYEMKCLSCHKLTDERLVGPGWKGVTQRRAPEWIMNFSTNTDEMLNKDAAAQAMLETCLIRMPNQNLNDEDARSVLEFMRQNDGLK